MNINQLDNLIQKRGKLIEELNNDNYTFERNDTTEKIEAQILEITLKIRDIFLLDN